MSRAEQIKDQLEFYCKEIGGRAKLLAVSKTFPIEDIEIAWNFGQRDFGENKVQDLVEKAEALAALRPLRWHMIGHLQSNKINMLLKVPNLVSIHSIDRMSLVDKILVHRHTQKIGLFLQYNTSNESEKGGFESYKELKEAAFKIIDSESNFYLQGLMTMGKIRSDDFAEDARKCFSLLSKLRSDLKKDLEVSDLELSMGMSSDFYQALEFNSSWIRIGTGVFGSR